MLSVLINAVTVSILKSTLHFNLIKFASYDSLDLGVKLGCIQVFDIQMVTVVN